MEANVEDLLNSISSGHALSQRKLAKKAEKQPLVVPEKEREKENDDEEGMGVPPGATVTHNLPPSIERLRWWTERLGGWYGWAFVLFVWLLMWEEPADYTGLVSPLYTIKGSCCPCLFLFPFFRFFFFLYVTYFNHFHSIF